MATETQATETGNAGSGVVGRGAAGYVAGDLPEPYFEGEGVTLYHGDCFEIAPQLGTFDLLLTDPPYGIGRVWKGGASSGWAKARAQTAERNEWDGETPDLSPLLPLAPVQIVWGGNHFALPESRGWLVWSKPERGITLSEAELAWTNRDTVVRVFDWRRSDPGREHPTQKPLAVMEWCLTLVPDAATVLDPFAGSGTTLVAAKALGRRCVGIEKEERYCEMAARRLSQTDLFSAA